MILSHRHLLANIGVLVAAADGCVRELASTVSTTWLIGAWVAGLYDDGFRTAAGQPEADELRWAVSVP